MESPKPNYDVMLRALDEAIAKRRVEIEELTRERQAVEFFRNRDFEIKIAPPPSWFDKVPGLEPR